MRASVPLKPLADRIVVKPLDDSEKGSMTQSGIIIPDTAKEKSAEGTVVAVGPGKYEDGVRIPVGVSVGDRVMVREYSKNEIKSGGTEYWIVAESDILAVITK
jgi:chaperonin GroES